uniref:NADH-ubiquinone oxidoreductase chain 4 n=1 Tax=Dolichoderus sibiricus TaxID=609446 RepID=A0A8K1RQK2_9HYME|nr:NADH dehydrogenase subunit 4 [Dolichoderus sibiricus]
MMKFIFMLIMMMVMMKFFKMNMFMMIYNLLFLLSFFYLFMYFDSMGSLFFMLSMSGYLGLDNYSYFMNLLSIWILSLMFMTLKNKDDKIKMYMFIFLLIVFIWFFSSLSLMMFYFFFEVSLIPTFFLIIYWGNNPERLNAAMYLMMYTLFISLPLLIYVYWLFKFSGSFEFKLMGKMFMIYKLSFFDYSIIFTAFFIKLPIYTFHVWLPKAHVEAPVYGSMVLAAVLLKLGGYGLLRMLEIFLLSSIMYNYIIFSISIIGSIVVSVLCLTQIDLKSLVAYSSVVHMNFMLCSMLTMFKIGFIGAYIMMIGHGLCSSGLFYMVNIYYSKSNSRVIFLNKGLMSMLSSYSLWWFLLCCSNFSFPLSINFFSEVYMISSIINWDIELMFFLMMICFFSGAYSLFLYSYIYHGNYMFMEEMCSFSLIKEFLVLILHCYPMVVMMFNLVMLF